MLILAARHPFDKLHTVGELEQEKISEGGCIISVYHMQGQIKF